MKRWKIGLACAGLLSVGACGPFLRPLAKTMENGEVLQPVGDATVERARVAGELERERLAEYRGASVTAALSTCSPEICDAVARGELALGMTESQVLAATRTTPHAWESRASGGVTMMSPRPGSGGPSDAVARIAFVGLQGGQVSSYTYREPHGFRTVTSPQDATFAGRAAAQADALLRQGDEYTVAGSLDRALERYDQADILRPGHPETTLRIARTLDKQLRPIEAVLRYQMFIHQMELEKIHARGEVAARIAEAIARAHERIVVIERR